MSNPIVERLLAPKNVEDCSSMSGYRTEEASELEIEAAAYIQRLERELEQAREIAMWHVGDSDECGEIARAFLKAAEQPNQTPDDPVGDGVPLDKREHRAKTNQPTSDAQTFREVVERLNAWLDSPHPDGMIWLDHVSDSFMDAWGNADALLDRTPSEPPALGVTPIAAIHIGEDGTAEVLHLYAPGLPPGEHDLFPIPLDPRGEMRPFMQSEPPTESHYWMQQIVDLVEWDDDGAMRPRKEAYTWETVARIALDYARAALTKSDKHGE